MERMAESRPVDERRSTLLAFLILMAVSLLTMSPLLGGGALYLDDFFRAVTGDVSYWTVNGRPLATWLVQALHTSTIVSDTSPVLQIAGVGTVALALAVSFHRLNGLAFAERVLLSLMVIVCPFLAQAVLYTYDALTILLSISLGFLGCISWVRRMEVHFGLSFVLFLAAICLYQIAMNYAFINIVLLLTLAMVDDQRRHERLEGALVSLAALVGAVMFYRLLVMPLCVTDDYNQARAQLVSFDASGATRILRSVCEGLAAVMEAFPGFSLLPVAMLFALGVVASGWTGVMLLTRRPLARGRYLCAAFSFSAPLLATLGAAGVMLLLNKPTFDPRVLSAFSSALIFHVCLAYRTFPRLHRLLAVCVVAYLVFSATFMASAFRAVVNQNAFETGLAVNMRADLSRVDGQTVTQVGIIGRSPLAPHVQPAMRHYPMMKKILFPALIEGHDFGYYALFYQAGILYPFADITPGMRNAAPERLLASNCLYRFYLYQGTAIFDFSGRPCAIPDKFLH